MDDGKAGAAGLDLLIEVAPRGSRRQAVEDALRTAIREGRLVAGARLPSSRALALEIGLSRGTVSQAYEQLTAEGWLVTGRGAGTRVANGAVGTPAPVVGPEPVRPAAPRHDLGPGRPDISSFPRTVWARALRHAIHQAPTEAFGYGDPRGRPELRTVLAGYLGRVRGVQVDPAHLAICSGFTQALGLLVEVFAGLGVHTVGTENPALGDHVAVVRRRLAVADLPVDSEGLRVAGPGGLAAAPAGAVVCTPAHQFPLGVSMSPARRTALLSWAAERDAWIVEDDYDGEFRHDRRPVGALQPRLPDRVAYVGSTSKSLGPAARLGWIACPPTLLEPLIDAKRLADRQTGPVEQFALAHLISSGAYDSHLRVMRRTYRRRRDALVAAIAETLPRARVTGIAAGLHAIVELPAGGPPAGEVAAVLEAASVRVHLLQDYWRGARPEGPVRLVVGYATPSGHAYPAALEGLVRALRTLGAHRDA